MNNFKLFGIKNLYYDMRKNKKTRERFEFAYNRIYFEVIFLIDRQPFELLIGIIGHRLAFVTKMEPGFIVVPIPDEVYYQLLEILNLQAADEHFTSYTFWAIVGRNCPVRCTGQVVQPHRVAEYKRNALPDDERESIYFVGWNDHVADGRKARNFEKTRLLLGDEVADYCKANNISSMWSPFPRDRNNYHDPW